MWEKAGHIYLLGIYDNFKIVWWCPKLSDVLCLCERPKN